MSGEESGGWCKSLAASMPRAQGRLGWHKSEDVPLIGDARAQSSKGVLEGSGGVLGSSRLIAHVLRRPLSRSMDQVSGGTCLDMWCWWWSVVVKMGTSRQGCAGAGNCWAA